MTRVTTALGDQGEKLHKNVVSIKDMEEAAS
jgi:hypothetical protein